ncbi:Arginyl-tRNA--protein transferase 1 [Acarospora aff. strigata]|nr:Arginyl-tRNA--protein transferase 1 [Acarospora aff. strigata]
MGVLDLLPHCVSAVYFIYHQDVSDWNFGKISALRESALADEGGYRYYYMGYYIHSCVKMRYKGAYSPQYVLDPESYTWDLLDDDLRQRLNVRNYVSLSRDRRLGITASPESSWLQSKSMTTPNFRKELGLSLAQFGDDFDYAEGQKSDSNGGRQHCSLFDLKPPMPGVMTKEEVERDIDLDRWKIKFHSKTYTLDCLLGWDESDIRDRTSPRGSLAEFAACIGPDLVRSIVLSVGS